MSTNPAAVVQLLGLWCGVIGAAMVSPALGFAVAALALLLVGLAMERG